MKKSISIVALLILTSCSAPSNSISPEVINSTANNKMKYQEQVKPVQKFRDSGVIHIKDGKLTINILNKSKFKAQAFNNSDVSTVKFEIKDSSGTVKDLGTLNYNNPDTSISVDVKTLTVGELYIVTMKAFYSNGDEMEGAEVKAAFVLVAGDQDVNLNYRTTPTAKILEAMLPAEKTIAKSVNISDLQTFIDNIIGVSGDAPSFIYANIHPTKVNYQNISNDLVTANGDVSALDGTDTNYVNNNSGSVKVKIEGLVSTDKVKLYLNDPSTSSSDVSNSTATINDVPVGEWKTRLELLSANGTTYTVSKTSPIDTTVTNGNENNLGTVTFTPATPTITSVTDTNGNTISSATSGTSIKITGTNFHKVQAGNVVKFGTTSATVTTVNNDGTEITVTVPSGVTGTQNITVEVGASVSSSVNFNIIVSAIFVDASASAGGDGTTWNTAYNDLQTAITNASSGKEIWVRAGTYIPQLQTDVTAPRSKTFCLKSGVKIYGGFAGTEAALSDRNINTNTTILSGDLGTLNDNTDNAYHVVTGTTGGMIDGFTITDGRADASGTNGNGGGIYMSNQSPVLTNLIVKDNIANNGGGGIYISDGSPQLSNIVFTNNNAGASYGGGMYILNGASPQITNSVFYNNNANDGGGAIAVNAAVANITNSVILRNNGTLEGGGIYIESATANIINSTIYDNTGGSYRNLSSYGSILNMKNSIVWSSSNDINADSSGINKSTFNIMNSDIKGGLTGITGYATQNINDNGGNVNVDPDFTSTIDFDGIDNFFGTSDDGLSLKSTSPIKNSGTNTDAPGTDITGSVRTPGLISMGAFEKD